jgi:HEAT repeat protein
VLVGLVVTGCATAPAVPVTPPPLPAPPPTYEEKMSWILRFEDLRVLRDPSPAPPSAAGTTSRVSASSVADLVALASDGEARVRRRAALAIGRVGQRAGVTPLITLLSDVEPEVRQMAVFGLGLIGDTSARDRLVAALGDAAWVVRGSAAEALGLLGDASAAAPIARLATDIVQSGVVSTGSTDEDDVRRDTPAAVLRLAIFALTRLEAYEPLASVVLDAGGQLRVRSWPVAYALRRLEDKRALAALLTLAREQHPYTRAFAAQGLGIVGDQSAAGTLLAMAQAGDRTIAVEAIRSLGRLRERSAGKVLMALVQAQTTEPHVRLEAVNVLGAVAGPLAVDLLIDLLADPIPAVRVAAIRGLAEADPEGFIPILSGLDPDPHWSVRAGLATVLGTVPAKAGLPRLRQMLADTDQRVIPAVLAALAKHQPADAGEILLAKLKAEDVVVRAAAATALGELGATTASAALVQAYRDGVKDPSYLARAAALGALVTLKSADAAPALELALADPDWAVRVRAAALLGGLDKTRDLADRARPAPTRNASPLYAEADVVSPPFSTHVFVETDRGTFEIELALLEAPLSARNFVTLARRGFFDGLGVHRIVPNFVAQAGDPRGDGEGGPGYSVRDELSQRPYLRGTVGMALDWADTGGSQFFVTLSPQPHLDAKYTVIGRVTAGMDVVDRLEQWDVIRRVRVWDGRVE